MCFCSHGHGHHRMLHRREGAVCVRHYNDEQLRWVLRKTATHTTYHVCKRTTSPDHGPCCGCHVSGVCFFGRIIHEEVVGGQLEGQSVDSGRWMSAVRTSASIECRQHFLNLSPVLLICFRLAMDSSYAHKDNSHNREQRWSHLEKDGCDARCRFSSTWTATGTR